MSLFRRDLDLFYAEGDDVFVFPVLAEEVEAYLGANESGATVRGMFTVQDRLDTAGDVAVEVEQPIFECTAARADAVGIRPYTHSIEHQGVRYNIVRRVVRDPGFYEFYLEELL